MKKAKRQFAHNPFALQLHLLPEKRSLLTRQEKPPPPKKVPKPCEGESEEEHFLRAMADVVPLTGRRAKMPLPTPQIPTLPDEEDLVMAELEALVRGEGDFELYYSDEYVEGALQGLAPDVLEKLRDGEYAWQGYIDLHGLRVDEARQAMIQFLRIQRQKGHRCVLIVHGRGRHSPDRVPVLKRRLVMWLTRGFLRKEIQAFATAPNHDGGPGALYLLLA